MGFFSYFFSKKKSTSPIKNLNIYAPISGRVVNIKDVPDKVFSEKIVGDGVAINPESNQILSPINGKIQKIFKTNHAFSIISQEKIELLIHCGIDTIKLRGKGFQRIKKNDKKIKIGDCIIKINLRFLKKNAKSIFTPIVILNTEKIKKIKKNLGPAIAGRTIIMSVEY